MKTLKSNIEPGTAIKVLFFLSALLIAYVALPMFGALFAGAVAAFVTENTFEKLSLRFGKNRHRSIWAATIVGAFLLLVLIPLGLFLAFSLQQAVGLFDRYKEVWLRPTLFQDGALLLQAELAKWGVTLTLADILDHLKSGLSQLAAFSGQAVQLIASATPEGIVTATLFALSWFFMLKDGKSVRQRTLPHLIPWDVPREIICKTTADVIRAVVIANVLVSILQSILVGIFLAIAGIPHALLLSGVAFFASFIPIVGTAPIFLFSASSCFFDGQTGLGIFLVICMFVVGVMDNFLRPFLVKGKGSTELSFFVLFVALVGGVSQFGLSGTLIGPLAFAYFLAFLNSLETTEAS